MLFYNLNAQTTNISGVINIYAPVTSIFSQSVSLSSSTGFIVGDKVVIIQMKGATIDTLNTSNFGTITSYNDAGNYEMLVISAISSNTITFTTPILRTYDVFGLVQLVKVPVYNNVNVTGILSCLPWNGLIGGVLVFEASGNIILNSNIDVTGKGFLGGAIVSGQFFSCAGNTTGYKLPIISLLSANKGEGITIIKSSFAKGMGALANGGGAGNDVNGGGAGGGNYGLGGHGGNTKCSTSPIAICGGGNGKNCAYSNTINKIFLGGGGGAGHENDGVSTGGVSGGGIVIIRCGGSISGNGNFINANGNSNTLIAGNDGQGGGGAGGVVLIDACTTTSLNISVIGGNGGTDNFSGPDCHGKGGGGSGGVIWTANSLSFTSILNGGNPGVFTNSNSQCFNTSNGATAGQLGGTLTGLLIPGATPLTSINGFSINTSSNCYGATNSTAIGTLTTTFASPVISYTWTNSSGIVVSQTNNTSSLVDSVSSIANGNYTLLVQMATPCGTVVNSQTININCVITPTVACLGTLTGTGMGMCNQYSFNITPSQTITPFNYGSQNYSCNNTTQPDVSFNIMGSGWRVNKFGWFFSATTAGQISGYNSTGVLQTFIFSPSNTITPLSYSGNFVQFAINGVSVGQPLNQNTFSLSLTPIVFGGNSYTYCTTTNTSIAISPTLPTSGGPWTYNWQPGNMSGNTATVSPLINTIYTVTANSSIGCPSSSTVAVTVTCVTTPTVSQSCPGSLLFDGTHPAVDLPAGNQYYSGNNGGYTWECWFKLNQPFGTDMRPLISAVDGVLYEDQWFGFGWQGGWYNEPVTSLVFKVDGPFSASPTGPNCSYAPPGGYIIGSWYHAAGVMDYTNQISKLFLNGILVDSKPITSPPITRVIPSQLCLNWGGTPLSLYGNMDEVRIWERAVTDTEIFANYDHCLIGNEQNLLVYYRCNQPGGNNVIDATPNNNIGTFSNLPSWSNQQPSVSGLACSSGINLLTSSSPTICAGSNTTLTATGATTYTWANAATLSSSTGSVVIASPNITTNYTVTGINSICSNTAIVTVSVNPSPTITATSVNNTFCGLANGTASVTSLPANNTYTWSSGVSSTTNTASNLAAGNYTVTAIDGSCQTSSVITILSSIPLSITGSTIMPTHCNVNDGSISVTDNLSSSSYSWTPLVSSINNATNLATGNYSLTITNGACSTSSVFIVTQLNGPTALNSIQNNAICESNGNIKITNVVNGLAPYQYSFNNSGFSPTTTYINLTQGVYTVTVKDANSCFYTQTLSIVQTTINSIVALTTNTPNCESNDGSFVIDSIKSGTPPYFTSFNNTSYTSNMIFENLSTASYTLNVRDSNMCETRFILIMPENNRDYTLYIPNTFTPNKDKVNDVWYIQGSCLGEINCLIYNRWGEKIIELNDIKDGWDGNYKGKEVPDGVYVYIIEVKTNSGTINKAGHITLFR